MGSVLSRAQSHYAGFGTLTLEIAEWGEAADTPLVVHYTPMTAADFRALLPDMSKLTHEALVNVVIAKAKDEKGQPMFSLSDKPALMTSVDHAVTARLASAIIGKQTTVGDAVKN